jgi:hypothetical protein
MKVYLVIVDENRGYEYSKNHIVSALNDAEYAVPECEITVKEL